MAVCTCYEVWQGEPAELPGILKKVADTWETRQKMGWSQPAFITELGLSAARADRGGRWWRVLYRKERRIRNLGAIRPPVIHFKLHNNPIIRTQVKNVAQLAHDAHDRQIHRLTEYAVQLVRADRADCADWRREFGAEGNFKDFVWVTWGSKEMRMGSDDDWMYAYFLWLI